MVEHSRPNLPVHEYGKPPEADDSEKYFREQGGVIYIENGVYKFEKSIHNESNINSYEIKYQEFTTVDDKTWFLDDALTKKIVATVHTHFPRCPWPASERDISGLSDGIPKFVIMTVSSDGWSGTSENEDNGEQGARGGLYYLPPAEGITLENSVNHIKKFCGIEYFHPWSTE